MTKRSARPMGEEPLKIRVAHVSAYPPRQLSGITRVILSLASAISSQGIRFSLWCPRDGDNESVLDVVGIPVPRGSVRNLALAARTFIGLIRKRSGFDVIHAHQPHVQSVAALLAGRILGVPSVLTFHVRVPQAGFARLVDWAAARLGARLASEVVAVADRVRQDYAIERCSVIHNGVTPAPKSDGPSPAPASRARDSLGLHLIFAGRVTETKGIFDLLRALALASSHVEGIRLTTYGSMDSPERYEEAKRSLGIQGIVEDRGFQEEWREHLRAGQVFVLPSFYEGLPMAVLEAMAAGLCGVATPVGGISAVVIPNRTGVLVPVGDPATLSAALVSLAQNPEMASAMGREARTLVEAEYSNDKMASAYASLYYALFNRGP